MYNQDFAYLSADQIHPGSWKKGPSCESSSPRPLSMRKFWPLGLLGPYWYKFPQRGLFRVFQYKRRRYRSVKRRCHQYAVVVVRLARSADPFLVVSLEGRMFPVEVCYLKEPCADYTQAAVQTVFDIHLRVCLRILTRYTRLIRAGTAWRYLGLSYWARRDWSSDTRSCG